MIDTNNQIIADSISLKQLHDIILKNAQIKLLDYTKSALLKHNRSEMISFGLHDNQFYIGKAPHMEFLYELDNPHLKKSDDQDKINKISRQMLIKYFNHFDTSNLISIAIKSEKLCDRNILKSTLITNYLDISTDTMLKSIANYVGDYCLQEFTVYWLSNFKIIKHYCQKNHAYLDMIVQPYTNHVDDDSRTVTVLISKIADLITEQYPDYVCNNLIAAINCNFIKSETIRINLPLKYLELYFELKSHYGIFLKDNLSPIPVNCQIITDNDEKYLVKLIFGELTFISRFTPDRLDKFIKLGLTLDVNNHQADIKKMINGLKQLPKAEMILQCIDWLQKTFL